MPKRRTMAPARPVPIQLPLFAEAASLIRVRQLGRIATEGRCRLDLHPDPGATINALAKLARAKCRRGYQTGGKLKSERRMDRQLWRAAVRCSSLRPL
jgi:predicted DNA-binding WGR domain protein